MKKIFIFILTVFLFSSCESKKAGCTDTMSVYYSPDADFDDGSCKYAGTDGNVTLKCYPLQNGIPVVNKSFYYDTVYIRFNVKEVPINAPTRFDTYFIGKPGTSEVDCKRLKPGYYYLFAAGYDSTNSVRVMGGLPFSFTKESGEIDVDITVQ